MTCNADLMYDTRPPSPHRSRIILGDGSIRKVKILYTQIHNFILTESKDMAKRLTDVGWYKVTCRGI